MYRVALLEKDERSLKNLDSSFEWSEYSMEVVGKFRDTKDLISYLKTNDVDVIFTETELSDMSGLDLVEEVKNRMGRSEILFVAVSENISYETMRRAMRLGVKDYCKKPLEPRRTDNVLPMLSMELRKLGKDPRHTGGGDFDTLLSYINSNYDKALRLDDLSRKFYFNPNYLCMLFRRRMDTTFVEYVKSIRMNKAKELFDTKNLTVSEVSGMVGYRDYSYFHKTFSAYFGVTPAQYKKKVSKS